MTRIVALLLASCAIAGLGAGSARGDVVTNTTVPVAIPFVGCSGEEVLLEGTMHIVASSNSQGQFFRHETIRAEGIGASGNRYVLTAADNDVENVHGDGLVGNDAFHVNVIAVGERGTPDDQVAHGLFRVTVNANGEITSSVARLDIDCH